MYDCSDLKLKAGATMNEQYADVERMTVEELKVILDKLLTERKGDYDIKCIDYGSFNFELSDEDKALYLLRWSIER